MEEASHKILPMLGKKFRNGFLWVVELHLIFIFHISFFHCWTFYLQLRYCYTAIFIIRKSFNIQIIKHNIQSTWCWDCSGRVCKVERAKGKGQNPYKPLDISDSGNFFLSLKQWDLSVTLRVMYIMFPVNALKAHMTFYDLNTDGILARSHAFPEHRSSQKESSRIILCPL